MKKWCAMLIGLLGLAAFVAVPVYAQTEGATGQDQTGMQSDQMGQEQQTGQQEQQGQLAQGPLMADDLMGASVMNQQDENVGSVGDLVLSDDGQVEYVVLSQGGVLGFGNEMIPIPWDQVQIQDQNLRVNLDQQKLEQAPSFSGNEWGQVSRSELDQQVRGYYGDTQKGQGGAGQQQMQDQQQQKEEGNGLF